MGRRLTVSPFIEESESPISRPPALLSDPFPEVFPPTDPSPMVFVWEEIPEAASKRNKREPSKAGSGLMRTRRDGSMTKPASTTHWKTCDDEQRLAISILQQGCSRPREELTCRKLRGRGWLEGGEQVSRARIVGFVRVDDPTKRHEGS